MYVDDKGKLVMSKFKVTPSDRKVCCVASDNVPDGLKAMFVEDVSGQCLNI